MSRRRNTRGSSGDVVPIATFNEVVSGLKAALTCSPEAIDPFCGDTSVEQWVKHYERAAKLRGWDDIITVNQLFVYFKGGALQWLKTEDDNNAIDDLAWADLKPKIINAFGLPGDKNEQRRDGLKQQADGEDPLSYLERVRSVCNKLKFAEDDTVSQIIAGLNDEYYRKVSDMEFAGIDALRSKLRGTKRKLDSKRGTPGEETKRQLVRGDKTKKDDDGRRCYKCHQVGHLARDCHSTLVQPCYPNTETDKVDDAN